MDYSLQERQRLLQQTARVFFQHAGRPRELEAAAADNGFDHALWSRFADLGWLGLLAPADDGDRPTAFDAAVLVSEFGRALAPCPYVQTAVLSMRMLDRYGGPAAREEMDAIARGDRVWAIATVGTGGSSGAVTDGAAFQANRLSGTRGFVEYGEQADRFLVSAGISGAMALGAVEKSGSVSFQRLSTLDDRPQAEVTFSDSAVLPEALLVRDSRATDAHDELQAWGAVMASAEMSGMGDAVMDMTLGYLKDRMQFGRPVGSFQAVQHQAVDMSVDVQAMRLTMLQAAWYLAENKPGHPAIATAKAWASDALRRTVQRGHQLHGAVGFTLEHDMQRYYRRAKMLEVAFGPGRTHQLAVAQARIREQEAAR